MPMPLFLLPYFSEIDGPDDAPETPSARIKAQKETAGQFSSKKPTAPFFPRTCAWNFIIAFFFSKHTITVYFRAPRAFIYCSARFACSILFLLLSEIDWRIAT